LREARRIVCAVWSERRCARGILVFPVPPVRRIVMKDQKYVQSRLTGQYRSVTVGRYARLSRSCLDKYFHSWPRLQWSGTLKEDTGMLIEIAWSGLGKHVGECALLKKRSCVTFLMGLSVRLHNALIVEYVLCGLLFRLLSLMFGLTLSD